MKLSKAISELQDYLNCRGDMEVTYSLFTIEDIKDIDHYDDNGNLYKPYNNGELAEEIIQKCEIWMWDSVSDKLLDSIEDIAQEVVKRRKNKEKRYQQYLELKREFESGQS